MSHVPPHAGYPVNILVWYSCYQMTQYSSPYSIQMFLVSSSIFLWCDPLQDLTVHVGRSHLLFLAVIVPSDFPCFMTWTVFWSGGQVTQYRMPFEGDVFLPLTVGYQFWGGRPEVKYHFHDFTSRVYMINTVYHCLPWSPGWGHWVFPLQGDIVPPHCVCLMHVGPFWRKSLSMGHT